MSDIKWQSPELLKNITGYEEYILEVDDGISTNIVHAIHLESIDCFWDVSADYDDDKAGGFVHKSDVVRFVKYDPLPRKGE